MQRRVAFLVLLLQLPACDMESPADARVSGIFRHSGNEQQGAIGTLLHEDLVVVVADSDGEPAPDRTVTFEVVEGTGRLTRESGITNASGLASTRLILGTAAGTVVVRASAAGVEKPVLFTATAVLPDTTEAPDAGGLYLHSGDGQEAVVGTLLREELVVVVVGDDGAPMPNRLVTFEVVAGSARLSVRTDVTNASGRAAVLLFLGATPGPVVVRAATPGLDGTVDFHLTGVRPEDVNAPADSGLSDYALRFDAARRHEVYAGVVWDTGRQYTAEAWIRLPETIPLELEGGQIIGQHASYADAKGTLDIYDGRLRFYITTTDEIFHELMSEGPVPLGRWVHVAGVYDGQAMRLYIDGAEVGSVRAVGTITSYDQRRGTRIGGYAGTMTEAYWFCGDMDEVRIWSVARTSDELRTDMYHSIEAQSGLTAYWPFDDGGGLTAADQSGHGYDGQLTNYKGSGYPTWVPGVFTEIDAPGP